MKVVNAGQPRCRKLKSGKSCSQLNINICLVLVNGGLSSPREMLIKLSSTFSNDFENDGAEEMLSIPSLWARHGYCNHSVLIVDTNLFA
ncbi:hypothetical protein NPIL_370891 [Nephila pilipes]|uniref:Uncharacterized protein n=1 Tax=Nephila pilipes TaxID=299642 RepID=A0A8X6Q0T7_NEPPI|nr:hypothetical protein NPIL_370891 [Nephila pilipes]